MGLGAPHLARREASASRLVLRRPPAYRLPRLGLRLRLLFLPYVVPLVPHLVMAAGDACHRWLCIVLGGGGLSLVRPQSALRLVQVQARGSLVAQALAIRRAGGLLDALRLRHCAVRDLVATDSR